MSTHHGGGGRRAAALAVSLLVTACATGAARPPVGAPAAAPGPGAPASASASPAAPGAPGAAAASEPALAPLPDGPLEPLAPRCPVEMALVTRPIGPYCIDRWEAILVVLDGAGRERPWPPNHAVGPVADRTRARSAAGVIPQGYISGEQAAAACARSDKRLCEVDEWVRACRGPDRTLYPYGDVRRAGVCNDRFRVLDKHPVVRLFQREAPPGTDPREMWSPRWMSDPRLFELDFTVEPTGARAGCTNAYGVYDMVGNLHEWVADPEGTFFGGYFMDT
ncbi:MAG TPA: SUMF1/EgtB/PvdO family nonheme iron enzyme, partial [Polyangiaceae bacterium]|nr:SUMF1/EgtB/PvdO family nonheme iron enzyme [Polyangiaceae bacterium]